MELAEEHGSAYIDLLAGPPTGRAMAPLATIDFVGWDVHRAIVDHLRASTHDEAHDAFALPPFMDELMARGHLGDKTAALGGFYRREGAGKDAPRLALDARQRAYVSAQPTMPPTARRMTELHTSGRHGEAFDVFAEANGDTGLMRDIVLGYISYALGRVGEVVERTEDVDRIMAHGFRWAPPGLLCDLIGTRRTIRLLEQHDLPVPRVLAVAANSQARLYPDTAIAGFFPHAHAA